MAVLLAVAAGGAGLMMSSAGAQTPPDFPQFPDFTFPDFSVPPPTMPPTSFPTITVPTPPTMPVTTVPLNDALDDFFQDLLSRVEQGSQIYEELRDIIADFGQ
jgi:hypothetical protein